MFTTWLSLTESLTGSPPYMKVCILATIELALKCDWLSYPWPGAKTSPGVISKTQICHFSNHLFSHTYPSLTAIKLQAWPFFKGSSLNLQLTSQLLISLSTWVADKRFLYVVVI